MFNITAADVAIIIGDGLVNILQTQLIIFYPVGVDLDLILFDSATKSDDIGHPLHRTQPPFDHPILQGTLFQQGHPRRFDPVTVNFAYAGG